MEILDVLYTITSFSYNAAQRQTPILTFSNNLQLLAQCDTQARRKNSPLSSMWRGQKLTAGNEIFPERWSASPEHGDTASGKTRSTVPVGK